MDLLKKILAIIGFGSQTPTGAQKGTEVTQLPPDGLKVTQSGYLYNRHTYRTLLFYALVQAGIILVLIAIAGWIIVTAKPQDRFFVASVDGRIIRIVPLDMPNASNSEMYVRVGNAVAAALTFGFLDFEQRRIEVGSAFEPNALKALQSAFLGATGVEDMQKNSYVYVAKVEPSRPGGVIRQGVRDNIYEWVVSVPLVITRKTGLSEEGQVVSRWDMQVLVQRAKALEISRGFTITALTGSTMSGPPQPVTESQVQGVAP